jgi:hypothetical protein
VVHWTGQHSRELGLPQPLFDRLDLRFGIADRAFVIFGDAELEIIGGLGDVLFELLEPVELAFDVRALP